MARLSAALLIALATVCQLVHAAPLAKRVSQDASDSTHEWVQACMKAGGGVACKNVAVKAVITLSEAASPCAQQNAADSMVNLAKQLFDDADMIRFAQIFVQQPRNSPTNEPVPYCQEEPQNDELKGLYQCQFASAANANATPTTSSPASASASAGTIPFGLSAPVSPAGACPAHPEGPIADGEQLVHLTQDPGLANVPVDGVAPTLNGGREAVFSVPLVAAGTTPSITRMNFCPPTNGSSSSSTSKKRTAARKTPRGLLKRAGQDLAAATAPWAAACGGAPECAALAAAGSAALRADADACAQQDVADAMVAHALKTGGDKEAEMVRLAQIYVQQPRNTPTGLSTPYCPRPAHQPALAGLFACQFQSADPHAFAGGLAPGAAGTRPFGLVAPLSPAGACAASPRGPVPDGLQLVDLVAEACAQM